MQKNSSPKAFSLIELSVVILIIGILISGVTQGSRLIAAHRLSVARTFTQSAPILSIPNLVFWLDATSESAFLNQSSSSEISDGDTVSSWTDSNTLVSDKRSCTEGTQANQPTYISNGINGLPVIRFNSTVAQMRLSCNIAGGINVENTIFMVFKWNSSYSLASTNFFVIGPGNKSTMNAVTTGGALTFLSWNGSNVDILSYSLTVGKNVLMTRYNNPTTNSSTLYIDGTSVSTSTSTLTGTYSNASTDTPVTIGNYPGAPRVLGGDIAEIIMYDRALKTEERKAVEQYLGKKWGIKIS